MSLNGGTNRSLTNVFLKGTVIAVIVAVPSLAALWIAWGVTGDLLQAALIGAAVHFISMIFSFKIAKKIFAQKSGA